MKKLVLISLTLLSFLFSLSAQLPGHLVISEYMANPEEVPNDEGEYVELYNTSPYIINLNGCVIQDGSGLYVAPAEDVYIQPGEFAAVGGSAVPYAHYYYPASPPPFSLNNVGGDQITVTCGGTLIAATSYTDNQAPGRAMELAGVHLHDEGITQEADYQPSSTPFRYTGATAIDYGSPGFSGNTFILPVELSSFEASITEQQVLLRWSTLTEANNSHFVIEHSTDGKPFLPIGRLSGAGNSQEPKAYQFLHPGPGPGLNYYRLRQVDFDGAASHSRILSVELKPQKNPLMLYPTTVKHTLTIEWQQPTRRPLPLTVFDLQGKVAASLELPAGGRRAQLPVGHLPPGTYVLAVPDGRDNQQARFFKK